MKGLGYDRFRPNGRSATNTRPKTSPNPNQKAVNPNAPKPGTSFNEALPDAAGVLVGGGADVLVGCGGAEVFAGFGEDPPPEDDGTGVSVGTGVLVGVAVGVLVGGNNGKTHRL